MNVSASRPPPPRFGGFNEAVAQLHGERSSSHLQCAEAPSSFNEVMARHHGEPQRSGANLAKFRLLQCGRSTVSTCRAPGARPTDRGFNEAVARPHGELR
jgi:hypothetical protein